MPAKSSEMDAWEASLMKRAFPKMFRTITKLVNMSLAEGLFALQWKTAVLKPLLQTIGLDIMEKSNCRPVSNLSFLNHLVKKCVLIQFNKHCADNTLLPDCQCACRANYSCETALVRMVNDIFWGMESQKITALTAIDLLAAFDTLDHEILLEVLQLKFYFTGQALHWFDSYLRLKGFQVIIEGQRLEFINLPFSVSQGSCEGLCIILHMLPPYRNAYQMTLNWTVMALQMIMPTRNSLMPILGTRSIKPCVIYPIVQVKSGPGRIRIDLKWMIPRQNLSCLSQVKSWQSASQLH